MFVSQRKDRQRTVNLLRHLTPVVRSHELTIITRITAATHGTTRRLLAQIAVTAITPEVIIEEIPLAATTRDLTTEEIALAGTIPQRGQTIVAGVGAIRDLITEEIALVGVTLEVTTEVPPPTGVTGAQEAITAVVVQAGAPVATTEVLLLTGVHPEVEAHPEAVAITGAETNTG